MAKEYNLTKEEIDAVIRDLGTGGGRRYWAELGCLLDHFSEAERSLIYTIDRYAKIKPRVSRIILGGTRVDTGIDYLRKLIDPLPASARKSELLEALVQMAIINKTRNDILHYGRDRLLTKPRARKIVISNALRARSPAQLREFELTPQKLREMTIDVVHIIWVLYAHSETPSYEKKFRNAPVSRRTLQWPWLYKQPPLLRRDQKSQGTRPKPKPRPRSSGT